MAASIDSPETAVRRTSREARPELAGGGTGTHDLLYTEQPEGHTARTASSDVRADTSQRGAEQLTNRESGARSDWCGLWGGGEGAWMGGRGVQLGKAKGE